VLETECPNAFRVRPSTPRGGHRQSAKQLLIPKIPRSGSPDRCPRSRRPASQRPSGTRGPHPPHIRSAANSTSAGWGPAEAPTRNGSNEESGPPGRQEPRNHPSRSLARQGGERRKGSAVSRKRDPQQFDSEITSHRCRPANPSVSGHRANRSADGIQGGHFVKKRHREQSWCPIFMYA
jgi:hypothetical protein